MQPKLNQEHGKVKTKDRGGLNYMFILPKCCETVHFS